MYVRLCPMCRKSQLEVVEERSIVGSFVVRQVLTCSDPTCSYSWWGRKAIDGDITDEMAAEVAH